MVAVVLISKPRNVHFMPYDNTLIIGSNDRRSINEWSAIFEADNQQADIVQYLVIDIDLIFLTIPRIKNVLQSIISGARSHAQTLDEENRGGNQPVARTTFETATACLDRSMKRWSIDGQLGGDYGVSPPRVLIIDMVRP